MHVLIVEDDERLAAALEQILKDNGYDVDKVFDGQAGLDYALIGDFDVIIMDVMMPKMDGFKVTSELRRAGINTPIILLTARDSTSDKIQGLDSGADDYMTKPFSPAELMAHLRALGRRHGEVQFERLEVGDLSLDLEGYSLACKGKSIQLSSKEFNILRILMGSPGIVISKDTLISKAWGAASSAGDNNVEAYISFLRKKLSHIDSKCKIETVRGAGYRFVAEDGKPAEEQSDEQAVEQAVEQGDDQDADQSAVQADAQVAE